MAFQACLTSRQFFQKSYVLNISSTIQKFLNVGNINMKDQWPTRSEDNKIQMNKVYTVADRLITEEDLVVLILFDLSIIGDKRTVSYLYYFGNRS